MTELIPAAGMRWMVVGQPRELLRDPDLAPLVRPLLPAERLDAFARGSGVDLRMTPEAAVAGYELGTLYLAATPWPNGGAERRFADRSFHDPVRSVSHPRITRLASVIQGKPETLVRVDSQWIAVAVGDPTPARAVELFALDKLKRSPTSLEGSALSTLPAWVHDAPLRFYACGPFSDEWASGVHGLLAAVVAAGASMKPKGTRAVVRLAFSGNFEAETDVPVALAAWQDLARSPLGRLLGLIDLNAPRVESDPSLLVLTFPDVALSPIAKGLHAAVAADVWDIMDLSEEPTVLPSHDSRSGAAGTPTR